jgi:hypothetical protein
MARRRVRQPGRGQVSQPVAYVALSWLLIQLAAIESKIKFKIKMPK